ncbi:MAG: hypothetical protein GEU71_00790 [Actinobacteria bacterium]|nr:hypothetical protein [Actinomycetota bacterium]
MRVRGPGFLLAGFTIQAVAGFTTTPPAFLVLAMGLIASFLWFNRTHVGLLIACVGLVANMAAIGSNGGMPVSRSAMARSGTSAIGERDARHTYADDGTRLRFLGDVIPVGGKVLSPGDVLMAAGLIVFLTSLGKRVLVNRG